MLQDFACFCNDKFAPPHSQNASSERIYRASAFTPNKDGFNDLFKTESYCEPEYFRMRILNRLGKIVFSSDNYNNTWDGTIEGTLQEEGIYLYIIEYVFPNQIRAVEKNTFTLLR